MNRLLTYWTLDPVSLLVIFFITWIFIRTNKNSAGEKIIPFSVALLLLIICFFSPLQVLSAHYLFSAHVIVHVILLLLAAPLLLLSLPDTAFKNLFSFLKRYPLFSWFAGVGMMWYWHIPAVFNACSAGMHSVLNFSGTAESLSLLAGGILFSAPVLHPGSYNRMPAVSAVLYLFTACIACSVWRSKSFCDRTGIWR